jgi:hypothetical protein
MIARNLRGGSAATLGAVTLARKVAAAAPLEPRRKTMRKAALSCLLLLLASAILGATVFREQIAQAAEKITTSDQPVPVAGTVTLGGTTSVEVADDREPFEKRIDASADPGDFVERASFTVPAGKQLVVEFMSVIVTVPTGQVPLVGVNADTGALGFVMPTFFQGTQATSVGTFDHYTGAMKILDFAEPEEFYDVFMSRDSSTVAGPPPGRASMTVYLSGYLVDA